MLLSDIDPALNANPDTFDMSMFAPTYALINGRPYDGTAGGTLPIVSAPGHDVLLRIVNAGGEHPSHRSARTARERGRRELARAALSPLGRSLRRSPPAARRRARAPAVGSVGGRALRALRHEPPPLQRHPGRLWRNAHHDRRDRHMDDILRRARHLARAGPGHHRRDRGSRVQRVRHSLRRGTGDDRHGGRVLRRHRRRRRIGHGAIPLGPNPLSGSVPQAEILGLSEGRHTIYVHGRDSTGAWGEVSSDTFIVARIGPAVDALSRSTRARPTMLPARRTSRPRPMPRRIPAAPSRQPSTSSTPWAPRRPAPASRSTLSGNAAIASWTATCRSRASRRRRPHHPVEAQDDLGNWGATRLDPARDRPRRARHDERRRLAQPEQRHARRRTATPAWSGSTPPSPTPARSRARLKSAEGFIDPVGTPADGTGGR